MFAHVLTHFPTENAIEIDEAISRRFENEIEIDEAISGR